jgi:hypothetical protein
MDSIHQETTMKLAELVATDRVTQDSQGTVGDESAIEKHGKETPHCDAA